MKARDIRRFGEYSLGDIVTEGSYVSGRVVGLEPHRKRGMGYLLLWKKEESFTIYSCDSDVRSGLSLSREIPDYVMAEFSKVILDISEEGTERFNEAEREPVEHSPDVVNEESAFVEQEVEEEVEEEVEQEEQEEVVLPEGYQVVLMDFVPVVLG